MIENLFIAIPARSGSKRIPNKNLALLGDEPLIGHTIRVAKCLVGIEKILLSTDSEEIAEVAMGYGLRVPHLRPKNIATDISPDIEWVRQIIKEKHLEESNDYFAILRPTNPFRTTGTILKAFEIFKENYEFDSLRAIRLVKEHPGKMWIKKGLEIQPLMDEVSEITGTKMHSSPFQALPEFWIQDASLEITKIQVILQTNSIAGGKVLGFQMPDNEGFDINYEEDLIKARSIYKKMN